MSRIVVGMDGSPGARAALRCPAGFAAAVEAPLHVVAAWHYPADAVVALGRLELPTAAQMDRAVADQLDELVDEAVAEFGVPTGPTPIRITREVVRGSASAALLRVAAHDTWLLVVGSRGLGGFEGLVLGSVSRQLCEHAPCPVTVVHGGAVAEILGGEVPVVAAVDGSDHAARALLFAAEVATRAGAELVVVNATGPDDPPELAAIDPAIDLGTRRAWVEEWCEPLRERGVPYRVAVLRGRAPEAVLDAARDRGAGLAVVGSRGRGAVTGLLLGSVATALTLQAELPITVVPGQAAAG